jgi:predicted CXXCH cytochrome family protein
VRYGRIALVFALLLYAGLLAAGNQGEQRKPVDPAAWGSNHVGKPIPEYVDGDQCLFCHRNDIGTTWQKNAHGITLRKREDAPELRKLLEGQAALGKLVSEIEYFLGSRRHIRFLKKEGYGNLALLKTRALLGPNRQVERWIDLDKPDWNKSRFANQCAGCHTTAVDASTKTFSAFGLDCYTCHGDVTLEHSNDTTLIWLSKKRRSDSKAVISICAQCHVRGGRSRSSGLPYANNFVAGDNLFQDYVVDFRKADNESINPGDRHVLRNIREVALFGERTPTCLSCHDVHAGSSFKHRRLPRTPICADCHPSEGSYKPLEQYTVTSPVCDY